MKDVQAIVFDLGGVLVELSGVPTLIKWTGDTITPDELWAKWLASPTVRAFETGKIAANDFARGLIAELELPVGEDEFLSEFTYWPRGLFPGAMELVQRISPACTRAILSNTNAIHWDRFTIETELFAAFDHLFASHLMGKIKPDSDAFEHVATTLDCDPRAILFLDDNQINVDAARRMGMQAARVEGVVSAEEVLSGIGALRPVQA